MKTRTKISPNGIPELTENQRIYLKDKHAGKPAYLTIDERSNSEKIGFIEGAIDRFFFYQHLPGVYENFKDARGGLKWACNHTKWELDDKGNKREVTRSMSEIYANKTRTQNFIDRCEESFRENGYLFPDSEHYKAWRDSGIGVDEVYPPLLKLKEKYEEMKKQNLPVWRQ
jgi:hypothetical protein